MDNNTILDILFKVKNKKVSTTLTKLFFEEDRVESEMLNPNRIASEASSIPVPASVSMGIVDYHSDLLLTEDISVSNKLSWNTGVLKNFINPSYHFSYEVQLFDDDGSGNIGNQIYANDPSDWYFFYNSGQLTFFGDNSSHNAVSNHGYHIKIYQYVGNFGAGAGDLNSSVEVNQVAHGLVVGDLIYRDPVTPSYEKAIADGIAPEKSDVIGVVKSVIDVDNFVYQYLIGEFVNTGTGFPTGVEGDAIFLSNITSGVMTNIPPSTLGHISKPIGIILEANTKMILFQMRGLEVNASGGGGTPTGGIEYDYYVTENDFDDLKSALSDNSYLSVFVPNGTYSAPINPGVNALEVTNAKLVHGETRDGVIIDLNTITNGSSTSVGLKVSDNNAVIENITVKDFTVDKNYSIYGISGNRASFNNVKVISIRNSNSSYNGYGIFNISNSRNISGSNNDIDLSDILKSSNLIGRTLDDLNDINGIISEGGSSITNSSNLNNVFLEIFTMSNCDNINNLYLSIGDDGGDGINNCSNLSNINLGLHGSQGRAGVIRNSKNISNLIALNARDENSILNNCEYLSNIEIISSLSNNLITGIDNCKYLDNIKINNCSSNPIINSDYVNNLHLESNHLGLLAHDSTNAHLKDCNYVSNVYITSVDDSIVNPPAPSFLVNGVRACSFLNNISLMGSGTSRDERAFYYGFAYCNEISDVYSRGTTSSSFYSCKGLLNSYGSQAYANLGSASITLAVYQSCKKIVNPNIHRASLSADISGFYLCEDVSSMSLNLSAFNIDNVFNECTNVSNFELENISIGFKNCDNVNNGILTNIKNEAFFTSHNIDNCLVIDAQTDLPVDNSGFGSFNACSDISNCHIEYSNTSYHRKSGFVFCNRISNSTTTGTNGVTSIMTHGFRSCSNLVNVKAFYSYSSGITDCDGVTNSEASSNNRGVVSSNDNVGEISSSKNLSNCKVSRSGVLTSGYIHCDEISNCQVSSNSVNYGFFKCDFISNSVSKNTQKAGFHTCNDSVNILVDGISSSETAIFNCNSIDNVIIKNCNSDIYFDECKSVKNITIELEGTDVTIFRNSHDINGLSIPDDRVTDIVDLVLFDSCSIISGINLNNPEDNNYKIKYSDSSRALFMDSKVISDFNFLIKTSTAINGDYFKVFKDCTVIKGGEINLKGFSDGTTRDEGTVDIFNNSKIISDVNIITNDIVTSNKSIFTYFHQCSNISNCIINGVSLSTFTYVFRECNKIINIDIDLSSIIQVDIPATRAYGFYLSDHIVNCTIRLPEANLLASDGNETNVAANNF